MQKQSQGCTTILIVEDVTAVRQVLAQKFRHESFKILEACNGQLGLELVRQKKPDIILCDALMPVMDGVTMARLLSQSPLKSIPIIFLSILPKEELPAEIKKLKNVWACLWKNELTMEEVVQQVNICLRMR